VAGGWWLVAITFAGLHVGHLTPLDSSAGVT